MKGKKAWIVLIALIAVVLIFFFAYKAFGPKPVTGAKHITVTVQHLEGDKKTFEHDTDAEFLEQALNEMELVEGEQTQYGLWIKTVDGETADDAEQQWWGYDVNGEFAQYGVSEQPVADGDVFDFKLNVGY